jgi:hypothetical protein
MTTTVIDDGFVDSGSSPPTAAPSKPADGFQSSELPLSLVLPQARESVELPRCAECGVTRVSRKGVCRGACRQAAYRKSPAHLNNLARHSAARLNRRVIWRKRKLRDKAASNFRHISGPNAVGVPRLGNLDIKQHLKSLTPAEIQQAHERLEERRSVKLETGLCKPNELG